MNPVLLRAAADAMPTDGPLRNLGLDLGRIADETDAGLWPDTRPRRTAATTAADYIAVAYWQQIGRAA